MMKKVFAEHASFEARAFLMMELARAFASALALQSLTENASSIFKLFSNFLKLILFSVMAGLVPAIHVFLADMPLRRGCPAQGRA
jgi:nucleoside recognition membrane protein YjiH